MSRMKHTNDDLNSLFLRAALLFCLIAMWVMAVMPGLADWLARKG